VRPSLGSVIAGIAFVTFLSAVTSRAGAEQAASPPTTAAPQTPDPQTAAREAIFDVAFRALVAGDLDQAERAFLSAAALPGDPAARAVATSFAARVRALRATRTAAAPSPPPPTAGAGPSASPPPAAPAVTVTDNAGHVPFLLTTTVLGLAIDGWALPGVLGIHASDSPRTFVGLYMVAGASSFVLPFLATRGGAVSAGQANGAFYGGTRGALFGLLAAKVIAGDVSTDHQYGAFAGSLLAGSVLGLTAGTLLGDHLQVSPGQAHTTGVVGDFRLGLGFGFAFLLGFDDADKTADQRARRIGGSALVGAAGGIFGGYRLARARDNSWGDAEVMRATGLVGVLAGVTVADGFSTSHRPTAAIVMTGGVVGAFLGDRLIADTDFSVGQSIIVDLATVAGGLASAGLLYLFSPPGLVRAPLPGGGDGGRSRRPGRRPLGVQGSFQRPSGWLLVARRDGPSLQPASHAGPQRTARGQRGGGFLIATPLVNRCSICFFLSPSARRCHARAFRSFDSGGVGGGGLQFFAVAPDAATE
jgi:hypothetical protein